MKRKSTNIMLFLYLIGTYQVAECAISHKVGVIGTGYVGTVVGACLASFGHTVACADINKQTIEKLKKGEMTIYEPGLAELVAAMTQQERLSFSDDPQAVISDSDVIFIAVGTPMSADGNADLSAVESVARTIGQNLNGYKIVCTKSTVPIGTGAHLKKIIAHYSQGSHPFDIVSNPEFLREGSSIADFLHPDRVIIGSESTRPLNIMRELYRPLQDQDVPFLFTTIESAETIKYAANTFLATKISFINEIADLCEKVRADVLEVACGIGLDSRIGSKFLVPGPGYGGSCFPKDVEALLFKGDQVAVDLKIARAAKESNSDRKVRIYTKLCHLLGENVASKKVAILGLSFKANTDDVRESSALEIIEKLLQQGAHIAVYDPEAMANTRKLYPTLTYASSAYEALKEADAAVLLTDWNEFRFLDLTYVKRLMRKPVMLDTRNILNTDRLKKLDFTFENIGNASVN